MFFEVGGGGGAAWVFDLRYLHTGELLLHAVTNMPVAFHAPDIPRVRRFMEGLWRGVGESVGSEENACRKISIVEKMNCG